MSRPSAAMRPRGRDAAWRSALGAFLVWAVVLAPTLGFMHRVVHLPRAQGRLPATAEVHPAHGGSTLVSALFAEHDDGDCRLYDQHCHGGTPLAVHLADLTAAQGDAPGLAPHAAPPPRAPAHFEARAPPARG
ncbi:hypothetical protein [Xylophilus sp.]|uniref:hypothetical protein n=1 Tax=Xylophilus sp. TaxID=2653893 RepID=UPI002D7F43E6|nr:hypothetical protein [Xylophilus sp.]